MATRPVFLPDLSGGVGVEERSIDFAWSPGMSVTQKQKSIEALHAAAKRELGVERVLEISSKSKEQLGVQLSAFNLRMPLSNGRRVPVEVAYQAGKEFEHGGPFLDLLDVSPRDARGDERLRSSGRLVRFKLEGEAWPLEPQTAFYDWLYLKALQANGDLASRLVAFDAFTDIEFNPEKSLNCQARSAALYVALTKEGLVDSALASPTGFRALLAGSGQGSAQGSLF